MMNRYESETVNFQTYDHMLTIQPLSDILMVEIRPKISSYLQKQNVNIFSVSLKDKQTKMQKFNVWEYTKACQNCNQKQYLSLESIQYLQMKQPENWKSHTVKHIS